MWIKSTREAHAGGAFKDERVGELNDGEAVSFSASGTAQVSAEVGEYLTAEYDVFVATDDDGDDAADATEEPDDTDDTNTDESDN